MIIKVIAAGLLAATVAAQAAAPSAISHQGYLTTSGGAPVTGNVTVNFRLYTAPTGGTPIWSEAHSVTVAGGHYSVALGNFTALDLPFEEPYFLGVTVGADAEMTPRRPLLASPYAHRARIADALRSEFLFASKDGRGGGTITSAPPRIICGPICAEQFDSGELVTLSATPDANSQFAGWTGACVGTGSCEVTMNGTRSVMATFYPPAYGLSVSKVGPGSLVSSPLLIYCGLQCFSSVDAGTTVTITPVPDAGASFKEFSGSCSGSACSVTMTENRSVAGTFGYLLALNVSAAFPGATSQVSSEPPGILCGPGQAACSAVFPPSTVVTLTATAGAIGNFVGWSGSGCAGTGTCTVTMSQLQNVSAFFLPI